MSSPGAVNPSTNDAQAIAAYTKNLPAILQETAAGTPGLAQGALTAAQNTQPGYNALTLQQLEQYGIPTAQAQSAATQAAALGGAQTNLAQIQGAGGQAAGAAQNLNQLLNPAYYNAINNASLGAGNAINAINLQGLSPGEYNATERSLNQSNAGTGNLGLLNNTNAISNAMNFGGAFNNKIGLMNNATNAASNVANAASGNAGFNPVNVALGQPNVGTSNTFGANSGTQAGSASNALAGSNGLLSGLFGVQNNAMGLTNTNQLTGALGGSQGELQGIGSNLCCFIFLESYNGALPNYVRYWRDYYYKEEPRIAEGYKRMAKWLVPLMKQHTSVRLFVNLFMVKPISYNGKWMSRLCKFGWVTIPIRLFWFNIWRKV